MLQGRPDTQPRVFGQHKLDPTGLSKKREKGNTKVAWIGDGIEPGRSCGATGDYGQRTSDDILRELIKMLLKKKEKESQSSEPFFHHEGHRQKRIQQPFIYLVLKGCSGYSSPYSYKT